MESTRKTHLNESTEQGPYVLTKTKAVCMGPTWTCTKLSENTLLSLALCFVGASLPY